MFPGTPAPGLPPLQRAGLALVAALLLFAGAAELVALRSGAGGADGTSRSTTAATGFDRLAADRKLPPRRRHGRVLVRLADAGFLAVVRDASDTSLLHVVVPHGSDVVDCNLVAAHVSVLSQDARQVRLLVSGYEYVPASTARSGSGGTTCVRAGTASIPVRLDAPLGHRPVFSGQAAKAVPVGSHRASVP